MIPVNVIGAGLAGCEATYQLIKRNIKVRLFEMRPKKTTEAHTTDLFGELVCSNSFRAKSLENAVGLLKEEMRTLDSIIMRFADACAIEAGGALAVDRHLFGEQLTAYIKQHPLVEVIHEEVDHLLEGPTIIASGPLTSERLSQAIAQFCEAEHLYFYDAIAPIIKASSIDLTKAYFKSRYDKGEASYINCPMTETEFKAFYQALITADRVIPKDFELKVFEGCMAIEDMAARGEQTLLYGPMKPVGLEDPMTQKRPFAVVQLRQDDALKTLYNIVGFQTHLKFSEQQKILRMIPGLEHCDIVRYGVMHRNTYIHSPAILNRFYQSIQRDDLFFAGQITGVEGYLESASSGLVAGLNMVQYLHQKPLIDFTNQTAIGSLANYIATPNRVFVPMNVNFGLFEAIPHRLRTRERKAFYAERALSKLKTIQVMFDD